MKFVVFVEGETEQKNLPKFLKRWLDPKLTKPVGIQPVLFVGWSELVKHFVKRANAHLNSPDRDEIIAVISVMDLYGPTIYPNHLTTANERYTWAKAELESRVGHPKFRQHFAVHECEAWLLSDPKVLPNEVSRKLPPSHTNPETVNFNNPPKKVLHKLYREKLRETYKEVVHGTELFRQLDPQKAYDKCPRLRAMLDEMLSLARAAGLGGGAQA